MNCSEWQEHIVAYLDGDLSTEDVDRLNTHLGTCPDCRELLAEMHGQQELFMAIGQSPVPENTLTRVRNVLRSETGFTATAEIMTLNDVAAFLKIPMDALDEIVEDLPLFELAGRIRIRRQALMEWIEERERDYTRQRLQRDLTDQLSAFAS